ncbi:MAG TPA: hypothetical protein VI198_05705, partial [Candidatus Eisenbacteria bacterium]
MTQPIQGRPAGPPPEGPPSEAIDPQDLLFRLRRYGWVLLLPIVACLCVGAIYARHTVPIYQAFLVVSIDSATDLSPALRAYAQGANAGNGP